MRAALAVAEQGLRDEERDRRHVHHALERRHGLGQLGDGAAIVLRGEELLVGVQQRDQLQQLDDLEGALGVAGGLVDGVAVQELGGVSLSASI